MGLFGGGNKTVKTTSSNYTSNYQDTSFHGNIDVGLTGSNALNMAQILAAEANKRATISAKSYATFGNQIGAGYTQLVGGANNLTKTVSNLITENISSLEKQNENLFSMGNRLVDTTQMAQHPTLTLDQQVRGLLPIITLIGGIIVIWRFTK